MNGPGISSSSVYAMIVQVLYAVGTFALSCLLFLFYHRRLSRQARLLNRIPGPPEAPVLGGLFNIFDDRITMFKKDRKTALMYYPIFRKTILHEKMVGILSPEDMEIVLSSTRNITKGRAYNFLSNWLGDGLLTSSGEKWKRRRKILTPAFHFNILLEFLDVFNEETKNLVNVLKEHCHEPYIDVIKPITEYTLHSINETAMGVKLSDDKDQNTEYKRSVYRMGELTIYRAIRPWLFSSFIYGMTDIGKEEANVLNFLHTFTKNVITQREDSFVKKTLDDRDSMSYSTRKRMALLDLLLSSKAEGSIDYEGIREEVDTFMFEGHDTTSMAICFALLLIANHPDVQQRLVKEIHEVLGDSDAPPSNTQFLEMKYLERCIKESLRIFPSVPTIGRFTVEEFTTSEGYTVPKGVNVGVCIYDMHHNPNVFEDPEKFDPDRFLSENIKKRHPFSYVPFSAGPRNCIGQKFAMLELKAALCGILREFELTPVHKPEDIVIVADLVLRPNEDGIRIKFNRRKKLL